VSHIVANWRESGACWLHRSTNERHRSIYVVVMSTCDPRSTVAVLVYEPSLITTTHPHPLSLRTPLIECY